MSKLILNILFSILLFSYGSLRSQEIVFEKILPEDGLSQIDVLAIHQDSRGFIWFGTQEGLNMYNGYDFKIFRKSVFEKNAIASNRLIDITEDSDRNIWIATQNNGINIYNPITNKMEWIGNNEDNPNRISNNRLHTIFCDSKNRIWANTLSGIDCITKSNNDIKVYTINENINPENQGNHYAVNVEETKNGDILIVRYNAITKVLFDDDGNPSDGVVPWFQDSSIIEIQVLKEIDNGFLLGTKSGIYMLKKDLNGQMKIISKVSSANVYLIAIDAGSNLWTGGASGLYYFKYNNKNPDLYTLAKHIKEGYTEYDISSDFIRDIYIDDQQTIWISTQGGGINKYNPRLRQFRKYYHTDETGSLSNNRIQAIHEDALGNIWIGTTGGGINLLQKEDKKNYTSGFTKIDVNIEEELNYVYAIIDFKRDDQHVVLSGNCYYPHLTELTYKNGKWHKYNPDIKLRSYINTLHADKFGYIWIGTYGSGIYKAKYINGKYEYEQYTTENSDIPSNAIRNMFEDSKGRIWIGTDNGLALIKEYADNLEMPDIAVIKNDPDDKYSLSENFIMKVTETSNNEIWIGTQGGGINILDSNWSGNNFKFKHINTSNGLPNNVITEILEDKKNSIWIGSNMGISHYNPADSSIHNYSVYNGLQGYAFVDNGGCILSDGELLFGGSNGLNAFYPDEITLDTTPPDVVFTKFDLMNNEIAAGDLFNNRTILNKDINSCEKIELNHKENSFTIHFSALHYIAPKNNQYKYMLKGFDKDWIQSSSDTRFAKYTNLDPGTYTFLIEASNGSGIWCNTGRSLVIKVKAPFYNTLIFKSLFIAGIILLIVLFYYFRLKLVRKEKEILEKAVQKRTAEINKKNITLNENYVLLEEQKEEIDSQKNELEKHRNNLEELIKVRTSELEKALKKAKESDKLKTAFLANMSHEIRTPMNAIIGFSDLLELADLTAEEKAEYVNIVKSNSKTLLKLINDIIDLSVVESDQLNIVKEQFSINEMLRNLFTHYSVNKAKENIKYKLNISKEVESLNVYSDEIRIQQVITNFMDNAYKFTASGTIELGANIENNNLTIYVKDSGRGISEDQLGYIFNRFTKIEKSNQNWEKGLGLGLAISKKIAGLIGGQIQVSSVENEGSVFSLLMPVGTME